MQEIWCRLRFTPHVGAENDNKLFTVQNLERAHIEDSLVFEKKYILSNNLAQLGQFEENVSVIFKAIQEVENYTCLLFFIEMGTRNTHSRNQHKILHIKWLSKHLLKQNFYREKTKIQL